MKKKSIKPLHCRCIVRRFEPKTETESGIIIPDVSQQATLIGVVIAVGPGELMDSGKMRKPAVKKDDTVMFGKYGGVAVTYEGQDYLILKEEEVLAVIS